MATPRAPSRDPNRWIDSMEDDEDEEGEEEEGGEDEGGEDEDEEEEFVAPTPSP